MQPGENGTIEAATLEFDPQNPPQDAIIIPVAV